MRESSSKLTMTQCPAVTYSSVNFMKEAFVRMSVCYALLEQTLVQFVAYMYLAKTSSSV